MLFSSIKFLYYFLPIVIALYFIVPKKLKNFVLLIANALHENGVERDVSIPVAQLKLFLQQHNDTYIKFVKSEMD